MVNRKLYLPRPNDDSDFETLFQKLTRAGAGRPVDANGVPEGPWSRVLADLDRKESAQRETQVEIKESIEAFDAVGEQRTVNEILGLER